MCIGKSSDIEEILPKKTNLYKSKFFIPWGSKLFVGIEDILLLWKEDANTDKSRYGSHFDNKTVVVDEIKHCPLKLTIQTLCDDRSSNNSILLENLTLLEINNFRVSKRKIGQTLTITNPWMHQEVYESHKCSPNMIDFQISLETHNCIKKLVLEQEKLSVSNKNHTASIRSNDNISFNVQYKFRFNYLLY